MKAVDWFSYEQFGCINCGSDNCYVKGDSNPSTSMLLTCKDCNTEFIVIRNGINISTIGIPKEKYEGLIIDGNESKNELLEKSNNENGVAIAIGEYAYPISQSHPRSAILVKSKK